MVKHIAEFEIMGSDLKNKTHSHAYFLETQKIKRKNYAKIKN